MIYFQFDHGEWGTKIAEALKRKVSEGVTVRLMVDGLGVRVDNVKNFLKNVSFLNSLKKHGIEVVFFKPKQAPFTSRVHAKWCAIDDDTICMGGSNIGDYYTSWEDANFIFQGNFGSTLHRVYDFFYEYCGKETINLLDYSDILEDNTLALTASKHSNKIHDSIIKVIKNAERELNIVNWHFVPTKEILEGIKQKLYLGTRVNIVISDRSREFYVDILRIKPLHTLKKHGANVIKYKNKYLHSKLVWNDLNEMVIGSANIDIRSLIYCFETGFHITNSKIKEDLDSYLRNLIK